MAGFGKLFAAFVAAFLFMAAGATAQEVKHYRFAYDQPKTTGYGILGDIFAEKLKTLSKGTMLIDQYPGRSSGRSRKCSNSSNPVTSSSASRPRPMQRRSRPRPA